MVPAFELCWQNQEKVAIVLGVLLCCAGESEWLIRMSRAPPLCGPGAPTGWSTKEYTKTTTTIVDNGTYKTKTEAESGMKTIKVCTE
jgi:hypothetical protein